LRQRHGTAEQQASNHDQSTKVIGAPARRDSAANRVYRQRPQPNLVASTILVTLGLALSLPYLVIISGGAGLVRLVFPAYTLAIALVLMSWQRPLLLSFVLGLFAFTPFLRRLADFHTGFEAFNPVLLAPYTALLPTLPALLRRIMGQRGGFAWPFTMLSACVVYGALIALVSMRTTSAVYEALRWLLPVSLCAFIMDKPGQTEVMRRSLYISLLAILPILTVYGVQQYVNPPLWDTFWMTNVKVTAFGYPNPYEVRVFSMMNSPLSVAVFVVSAMILLTATGTAGLAVAAMALPLLALTLVRSAWLICAIGLTVLFLQASASQKLKLSAGLATAVVGGMALFSSHMLPPQVANQLSQRFDTFSNVQSGTDESADARLMTYGVFFDRLAKNPLGEGFGANASTVSDAEKRDKPVLDSAIVESALTFGVPVGMVYFIAMGTLVFVACRASRLDSRRLSAFSALLIGNVATSPLGANLFGEASILTWVAIGFLLANAELYVWRQKMHVAWLRDFALRSAVDGPRRWSARAAARPLRDNGYYRAGTRPMPM
jgi:hypothetical protein